MSRIWVPKFKIIEPKAEIVVPARMRGRFKLRVRKAHHGTIRHETPWFDNLILNNGLDFVGETDSQFATAAVGTDNTAPAVGQSELGSLVASSGGASSMQTTTPSSPPPYTASKSGTFSFGQGDAQGNLAEVGVGAAADDLFSRALILDANGDPTTLTIQADEFLDVIYELSLLVPETDVTGTIDVSGTSHDYTLRAANVTSSTWWALGDDSGVARQTFMRGGFKDAGLTQLAATFDGGIGAIDSSPSGDQDDATGRTQVGSYTSGDYQQDCQAQWGLNAGNFGTGIQSLRVAFGAWGRSARNTFQIEYDPVIDKGDTEVLTLQFRHSWDRAPASS